MTTMMTEEEIKKELWDELTWLMAKVYGFCGTRKEKIETKWDVLNELETAAAEIHNRILNAGELRYLPTEETDKQT